MNLDWLESRFWYHESLIPPTASVDSVQKAVTLSLQAAGFSEGHAVNRRALHFVYAALVPSPLDRIWIY